MPNVADSIAISKNDVPACVRSIARHIYCECQEAGYEITKYRWMKTEEFYIFEEWERDPIGHEGHSMFLISYNGDDSAEFRLE